MVANGQDIEAKDQNSLGQTALGWAAFIGYEDIVDYLLSQHANLWATDRADVPSVLKSAALGKNLAVFKKIYSLMKDQVNLDDQTADTQGETLMIVAASNDRRDIVEYLLQSGANPNLVTTEQDKSNPAYDQDALTFACSRHLTDMAQLLIHHGAVNHRTGLAACD
ncbi:ankyrin repeat domain-containing protein [Utexia brackfieldae]|uniref:ankyrin repeat domain-containing protein n=1 Tax=Utexia brackfieldae TaxID=3074108 RepID=UPI00370DDA4B